jgi:predicted RecB family nuclease
VIPKHEVKISASSFYNLSKCPRRVWMDQFEDPAKKGEHSDFVELLWARGTRIEREIIDSIRQGHEIAEVQGPADSKTFDETLGLIRKGVDWIYQGVLLNDIRIGRPDILERVIGKSKFGDYHYIPCDIKSGRATKEKESDEVKSHYANQMLFYCDLLETIQGVRPSTAKIIDAGGDISEFQTAEYETSYLESENGTRYKSEY